MKKYWFVLTALLNISVITSAQTQPVQSERMKLESFRLPSSSKGNIASKPKIEKNSGNFEILRRTINQNNRKKTVMLEKKSTQKYRSVLLNNTTRAAWFSIDDVWTSLDHDFDGDGYFSEFTVNFDANFSAGYADVFAELYLSKEGGPWVHYETTNIFTIHHYDAGDYYQVSTRLNSDFPTGSYDVLIDLYEAGHAGIVTSVSPTEFNSLSTFFLEDKEHELDSNNTLINYVASELYNDFDVDGFHTKFTLEYDIDTLDSGRMVYANILLTNVDTFEVQTVVTESFILGNQTEVVDLFLQSGYIPGWYDIEIQLVDHYTGQILANAAQDFLSLKQLLLESEDYDNRDDNPVINSGHVDRIDSVDSRESGGGSFGGLLLVMLMFARYRKSFL